MGRSRRRAGVADGKLKRQAIVVEAIHFAEADRALASPARGGIPSRVAAIVLSIQCTMRFDIGAS